MLGIMHTGRLAVRELRPLAKMPKRRKTSEQVTIMERMIRMMIIQVRPNYEVEPFVSVLV